MLMLVYGGAGVESAAAVRLVIYNGAGQRGEPALVCLLRVCNTYEGTPTTA